MICGVPPANGKGAKGSQILMIIFWQGSGIIPWPAKGGKMEKEGTNRPGMRMANGRKKVVVREKDLNPHGFLHWSPRPI
jgi:hypothetical protein